MRDVHIHLERGEYTLQWVEKFIEQARATGLDEIYLLEHSHRFWEFSEMYEPVKAYNQYQREWFCQKKIKSIHEYIDLIDKLRKLEFPIKVQFGLEVCYFPGKEDLIASVLKTYNWDFVTGSVHYMDGWGFDHQAEFWQGVDVDQAYRRYYQIMLELIHSGLFTGLAHPDSIKCFGHYPSYDLTETYKGLAQALNRADMYAEQSGGLALNHGFGELGLNPKMLKVLKENQVRILTASDAHRPEHVGANIQTLQQSLSRG